MRAVIFSNGTLTDPETARSALRDADLLIAADGGAYHCESLGVTPHAIIGDLDSLQTKDVDRWERAGVRVFEHPAEKDETDLELALHYLSDRGADEVLLLGLLGGRWDMVFANILLLAAPEWAGMRFRVLHGQTEMFVLRGGQSIALNGSAGDRVSVIPLGGEAVGLTYRGLEWPLNDATLAFGTPRGVSNLMAGEQAEIELREGVVLVVKNDR